MKKALPLLVLLLALVAAVVFTRRRSGGAGETFPVSRAAELAPAETVLYFEMADLPRTQERWAHSELRAISEEPKWRDADWQVFLSEGEAALRTSDDGALLLAGLAELRPVEPVGGFFAVTDLHYLPGAMGLRDLAKLVGGIEYRSKKTVLEAALRRLKERVIQSWSGGRSELSNHRGIEIESIHGPGLPGRAAPSIHFAFRDDWLFFATDRALLAAALDRYLHAPGATPGLTADAAYAEGRTHDLAAADLRVWARRDQAGKFVAEWLDASLPPLNNLQTRAKTLHFAWSLEGSLRWRLYLQTPLPPRAFPGIKQPDSAMVALVPANVPAFAQFSVEALREQADWRLQTFWSRNGIAQVKGVLARESMTMDNLWDAFGPSVMMLWLEKPEGLPRRRGLALQVRNLDQARKFAAQIALANKASGPRTEGEITEWNWGDDSPPWIPTPMVLTKTHLLFGVSSHDAAAGAWRSGKNIAPLGEHAAYEAARSALPPETAGLLFFDSEQLSQAREFHIPDELLPANSRLGPFSTLAIGNALRKHLRPGAVSFRAEPQGWLLEGTLGEIETMLARDWLAESWAR